MSDNVVSSVGFGAWDPQAVILLCMRSSDSAYLYPNPASDGLPTLSEDKTNFVLLTNVDRRFDLSSQANNIHRLIVFAPPERLSTLGIPVMDIVQEDGPPKSVRQSEAVLRARIEEEAVSLNLAPPMSEVHAPLPKPEKTLTECIDALYAEFEDFSEASIEEVVDPTVDRLVGETTKEEFQKVLQELLREYDTVDRPTAKVLYRWVEGIKGKGPELSAAVEDFGTKKITKASVKKCAKSHKVDPQDLILVLKNMRARGDD